MRRIRSHIDGPLSPGQTLELPEAARNHLTRVLRLGDGDPVTLFNGDGHDYPAQLIGSGKRIAAQVLAREAAAAPEAGVAITLVQALARGEKMDWIIQKATEIGVARIVPISSQRSEVRLDGERAEKRVEHWRKVAISACEQCGRARIPEITAPQPLPLAAETVQATVRCMLDPEASTRLRNLPSNLTSAALLIGPEGGLDEHELRLLSGLGWQGLRLGQRVLRTETAGLVAVSALFALTDEL